MRLFTELRRRNVFRMGVLYVVAAWLVMQVAGVFADLGVLPEGLGLWIMALLAIGFPIALIVSWFFDVTPEGVVREADLPEDQPALSAGGRHTDFVIIAMLAAAVILMLVWEPPASADEGLTVLPFESLTGPDEAGFSEGVSIELQSLLSRLRKFKVKHPPEASILARLSDIPALARELDVRWVLKGSVRRAENRVRIAVELIDADDDAAIAWSNVFDRELSSDNLFEIQAEIARLITSELGQSLGEYEEQLLSAPPTENSEAYTAYLIGRQRLTERRVGWLRDAAEQFAKAIDLDPDFGEAYSGLADACFLYEYTSGDENHERCPIDVPGLLVLARKAVRLAPESGETWISLGTFIWFSLPESVDPENEEYRASMTEAEDAFKKGLSLNPGHSLGYLRYAQFLHQKHDRNGTWAEAWRDGVWSKVIQQGLEVDPLSLTLHYMTSYPIWVNSREKSLWHARRIIEIAPDSPGGYERLGEYLWRYYGRADEMVPLASKAAQLDPEQGWYPWHNGHAYMALGDYDMAIAWFRLAEEVSHGAAVIDSAEAAALALLFAGRTDEAIERFESLQGSGHDLYPHVPLNVLAGVDLDAGRPEKALSRFRQYKPECFDDPEAEGCPTFSFMRVLQELGDEETFRRMLALEMDWRERNRLQIQISKELEYDPGLLDYIRLDAITGRHEQALSRLEGFVEKGFRGAEGPRHNWRFFAYYDIVVDSIRDHPRFQAATSVIEADMAQQLENVREMQRRGEVPTLEEVNAMIASAGQESGSDGE